MTREEAVKILRIRKEYATLIKENVLQEAIDMAIEALSEPIDLKGRETIVTASVKRAKERAIATLNKTIEPSDLIRCKDCDNRGQEFACPIEEHWHISDYDYCSWAERREP